MATLKEMCNVVDSINIDDPLAEGIAPFCLRESWYYLRRVMYNVEDNGKYYNGLYGERDLCTYWIVGDYIITYLTEDVDFSAEMLTEEMMDDLIIDVA